MDLPIGRWPRTSTRSSGCSARGGRFESAAIDVQDGLGDTGEAVPRIVFGAGGTASGYKPTLSLLRNFKMR
jgi:hypothetical protein